MSKASGKTVKIGLVGASGRMGQEIYALSKAAKGLEVPIRFARAHWPREADNINVVVDFSTPEGFRKAAQWCVQHKVPLVSGTTGLTAKDHQLLKSTARKIPVLYAANMSLGIALFDHLLKSFHVIRSWDFEIEEAHHALKKDKPSGTAILLQQTLEKTVRKKIPKIRSIREGEIPGTHQILAQGPEESLSIRHVALNRKVFAKGALVAARWLFDKKAPGLYDLTDLYKLT